MAIGVQTDMATPALARFGSDELRKEFLAPAIAGDMVGCIGVSEPGGGSDVAAVKTTAKKDGGDYVINGTKMWITNGMQADWCCLLANTSATARRTSEQVADRGAHGRQGHHRQKIRRSACCVRHGAAVLRQRARAQRNLIGQEGLGFTFQMLQFQEERLWGAASSLRRWTADRPDHRLHARAQGLRQEHPGQPGGALPPGRAAHRGRALRALTYRAVEMYVAART
jgi:citronellyl-CoA dehydrogenase